MLDAFLLRAVAVAGWEPALGDCARCSVPDLYRGFSVPAAGADARPAACRVVHPRAGHAAVPEHAGARPRSHKPRDGRPGLCWSYGQQSYV